MEPGHQMPKMSPCMGFLWSGRGWPRYSVECGSCAASYVLEGWTIISIIPMDPGVPLHSGLPLILKASVSAQLEQAMRECSPTEEI